ncbi:hypothetical protein BDZ94DRAFT_1313429 [Collybia nuda]|uniref:Uncharacterized protein n=1 Tax=Collybia nuda TaxID=64659 RepID=A0A9P5XV05_9AGAR|nr:hypothetical protein BDZ94DRAFT_1313429 [Collybia nuda]
MAAEAMKMMTKMRKRRAPLQTRVSCTTTTLTPPTPATTYTEVRTCGLSESSSVQDRAHLKNMAVQISSVAERFELRSSNVHFTVAKLPNRHLPLRRRPRNLPQSTNAQSVSATPFKSFEDNSNISY